MAVQYVKDSGGNNLLGMLGGLATLGGTLTGQGWLTGLGTGLGTVNDMMNGTAKNEDIKTLGDMLKEMATSWINPAKGNIAKVRKEISSIAETIANAAGQVTNTNPYMTSLGMQHKLKGF